MAKVDFIREAEVKAKEIYHEFYDVDDAINQKEFVTPLGDIAENLGVSAYVISFDDELKDHVELAQYFKEQEVEGFSIKGSNKIFVDDKPETARQRFTVAHELGHILLGHLEGEGLSVVFRDSGSSPKSNDPNELSANAFAAELLMPEPVMKEAYKMTNSIASLATIFGVTRKAVVLRVERLKELGVI